MTTKPLMFTKNKLSDVQKVQLTKLEKKAETARWSSN